MPESLPDYDYLLDLLPVGAMIIDANLKIVNWNRTLTDWTDIRRQDAVGHSLGKLFPNVAEQRYCQRLQDLFDHGLPVSFSAALHKYFLPIKPRHGLEGHMIQQTEARLLASHRNLALITIQDFSMQYRQLAQLKTERAELLRARDELQNTNEILVQRNRELDEFSYVASHDLQEPLRKITTFAQLVAKELSDQMTPKQQSYIAQVVSGTRRMRNLITDLLAFAGAGRTEVDRQPVDLNEVVCNVLDALELRLQETQTQVILDPLPIVLGDKGQLTQLYQNMIANALKFSTNSSPQIHINVEHATSGIVLGVKDNGIGIDPAYAEQIFKPFARLPSKHHVEGTGIGLSICKKVVNRHGGEIWVESPAEGGAHFRFTLDTPVRQIVPLMSQADDIPNFISASI